MVSSPDTIARGLKELATEIIEYTVDSGAKYQLNTAEKLNKLLLRMLLRIGQLKKAMTADDLAGSLCNG